MATRCEAAAGAAESRPPHQPRPPPCALRHGNKTETMAYAETAVPPSGSVANNVKVTILYGWDGSCYPVMRGARHGVTSTGLPSRPDVSSVLAAATAKTDERSWCTGPGTARWRILRL